MMTRTMVYGDVNFLAKKWLLTDFMTNFFRIGVPLFLMLSGALSLGRQWSVKSFLSKRLPRIVGPFLFWGFVLSLLLITCAYVFDLYFIKSFDLVSIASYIYNAYLYKSSGFYPYWFFWMILGTYFIMPIFNKWLLYSDLKEAEYFLGFWIITCIFDFTLGYAFPIKLTYFTSPIGLVVLGYYLRYTERKIFNNINFAVALIIIMAIVEVAFSAYMSTPNELYTIDRYSIFTTLEVIGVFILFKNWKYRFLDKENIANKFINLLARYSYGLYLVHAPLLHIYKNLFVLPYHILIPSLFTNLFPGCNTNFKGGITFPLLGYLGIVNF